MLVSVNNQSVTLPLACNLAGLVDHFGFRNQKGMAIAVNQQIIPKSTWDSYALNENDQVTIIHATQGG
jgi:sulfur carrier protein